LFMICAHEMYFILDARASYTIMQLPGTSGTAINQVQYKKRSKVM